MSTQEQQVRQSCNAIAAQVFLIAQSQHAARHSTTSTGSNSADAPVSCAALNANSNGKSLASGNDSRAEELRRLSEAVVRDAMTLYRLCHRSGGGSIVIVPASSSGGGGGAAEEAAYCVCAAIMSREARLWASMVRRAKLLRPRKPALCFVPPVVVPPVVVKDVVRFFGRSRHLVPGGGGGRGGGGDTASPVAPGSWSGARDSALAGVLSAQRAEAVAAAFFFKTMSAAERQRRPELFQVPRLTSSPSTGGAPSGGKETISSTAAKASTEWPSGLPGRAGADGARVPPSVSFLPPIPSATVSSRRAAGPLSGGSLAPLSRHPPQQSVPSSSLLFMDDGAGWRSGGFSLYKPRKESATVAGQSEPGDGVGGVNGGWPSRSSSECSSDSDSDGELDSRDDSRALQASERGDSACWNGKHAPAGAVHRRHTRKRDAATETAVLERLYRLATTDDAAVAIEERGEEEKATNDVMGALNHHSDGGAAAATSAMSGSLFTCGKVMSMVSLAAMTAQVQDALHWGRLMALVRFPLLFRELSSSPRLASSTPTAATAALSATSEALTAASMARLSNLLGSSYTSALVSSPSASPTSAGPPPASPTELHGAMTKFLLTCGSPGAFLSPARLRTSSLLPRPPSLVTDTFLWSRLLICGAWLQVYADSLMSDESSASSSSDDESSATSSQVGTRKTGKEKYARPRVRSSPLVKETITYCIAVVREARAISAGMTGEDDTPALSSSAYHAQGATRASASHSNIRAVCCPVCERLVKEQQPVLWWSTLREDRAQLREQVRSLLENGSATEAEARVAAAVAADGLRERRGDRQYAAPQLSGSGAARERIAALQEKWAAYVMGVKGLPDAATVVHNGEGAGCGETLETPQGVGNENYSPTAQHCEPSNEHQDGYMDDDESTRVLWAALTERVAAATDLSAFLSAHPISDAHPATRRASFPKRTAARQHPSSSSPPKHARARHGAAATGEGAKKRRRRSTSSDSSEEETSENSSSSGGGGDDDDSETDARPRRRTHHSTDTEAQHGHHRRSHQYHGTSNREYHDHDDCDAVHVDDEESNATTAVRSSNASTFMGSRHAREVAEEWERLLRRCGWVNVELPRPPTNASAMANSASSPSASVVSSPAAKSYGQWAASLVQPYASPSPQQAAVLRRRLSRYDLDGVVRVLVLGHGGRWSQYANLMFGADVWSRAQMPSSAQTLQASGTPAQQQQQQQQTSANGADGLVQAAASEDVAPRCFPSPRRAASMSLLEESADAQDTAMCLHDTDDRLDHDSVPRAAGHEGGEAGARKRSAHISRSPPVLTSASSNLLSPPLPPRPFDQTSPRPLPRAGMLSSPTRKFTLPSIPLHASPLSRYVAAETRDDVTRDAASKCCERDRASAKDLEKQSRASLDVASDLQLFSSSTVQTSAAATRSNPSHKPTHTMSNTSSLPTNTMESRRGADSSPMTYGSCGASQTEPCDDAVARSQLRAQQAAIRALLRFHPRFPPLREEDAVLECGSCFSLFHQDCIAPVQRDLMGQIFLCHTCRLRWARPHVERGGEGGLISQAPALPFELGR
ncbi:hypothetical protein ABL78_4019 [Leptomonas seymouri]|uniref:Uncharacterized protein n=1 Tax=Leptomonas seymouri TaxID=5684 RepID=A0A0N0P5W1_LEPSE|nr:hypothetical protein ABL78_4019 [Leptomonas seymouri]|eukprot:KPI86926.1 hypothetical protein ABL78_4019 [Leptomonas seymouri]